MSLDVSKLTKVRERKGKTVARCPACALSGGDRKCEHLVINEDGRFGCVVYPGRGPDAKAHRRRIFEICGDREIKPLVVQAARTPVHKSSAPKTGLLRTLRTPVRESHAYFEEPNEPANISPKKVSFNRSIPVPGVPSHDSGTARTGTGLLKAIFFPAKPTFGGRRYILRDRDGAYVESITPSETATVKMGFTFTPDREKARRFSYDELWIPYAVAGIGIEFTCGFAGRAERVQ
jgi:hypothetical protein